VGHYRQESTTVGSPAPSLAEVLRQPSGDEPLENSPLRTRVNNAIYGLGNVQLACVGIVDPEVGPGIRRPAGKREPAFTSGWDAWDNSPYIGKTLSSSWTTKAPEVLDAATARDST
jgi:hypothetical protein